ncbi:hypothetical protein BU17DRAFT_64179 [Hysterangium stoloniferum]|nr:hypothetical protein BU17DRAFT_64179 [Hysterangium stoloniferum]
MVDSYIDSFFKSLKSNTAFLFQTFRSQHSSHLHYLHDKRIETLDEPLLSYKALHDSLWNKKAEARKRVGIFSSLELDPGEKLGDGKGRTVDVEIIDLSVTGFRRDPTTPFPIQFLVRGEYKTLWKTIKPNNGYNYLIAGHPGIGKSWFLMYALIQRLTEGKPTIYAPSSESWYLFHSTGVYVFDQRHMNSLDTFVKGWCTTSPHPELAEEGTILFDCNSSQPIPGFDSSHWRESWRCIVAASHRHSSYSAFMERWPLTTICGMMLWSWHEIVAANSTQLPHNQRSIEELWELFNKYGPTPRTAYITSPVSNEAKVHSAIKRCTGEDLLYASSDIDFSDASRFLLVLEPHRSRNGKISRRLLITRIATNYIAEAIVENATTRSDLLYPLRDNFPALLTNVYKKDLAHMLFRAAGHRYMSSKRDPDKQSVYALQSIDKEKAQTYRLSLDIDEEYVFDDAEQLRGYPEQIYFRPAQDHFPSVDGLAFLNGRPILFRYATSPTCPIDTEGLDRLAKVISRSKWTYVFVLPKAGGMADKFTRQTMRGGVGLAAWKARIDQYVLALGVHDLFPLGAAREGQ